MGNLKKIFSRKGKGISDFITTLVCLGVIFAFLMLMVYSYGNILRENNVRRVHRKYLLSMEREGCLTSTYETALRSELAQYGVTNVNLNGTSMTPVGYGQTITLHIECDMPIDGINFGQGAFGKKTGGTKHVTIHKTGTAFY